MKKNDLIGKNAALFTLILFSFPIPILFAFPGGADSILIYVFSSALLLAAIALASYKKGLVNGLEYLWIFPLPKIGHAAKWMAATIFLTYGVTLVVSAILLSFGLLDSHLVSKKIASLPIPALAIGFTLAPFAEEAFFRGYLFRRISDAAYGKTKDKKVSILAGAALASLIFALLHFSYGSAAEIAVAFFISLVFCFATFKSGSLWPAILSHAAFNFLSIAAVVFA